MHSFLNDGATLWSDMLSDPDELFMNGASDYAGEAELLADDSDAIFQHNPAHLGASYEEDYDNE
tara:strand:- start:1456 stop:1647 length:192 start_codon:yes stop_codon:yes gene_type:complete